MKYREETRTREVPHTENGEPRLITEDYTVRIPVAPRDWDRIVLNSATTAAIVLTTVSVAWSTYSGGALLDRAAPAAVAYPVAIAFDAAWLTCQALEWLARYDAGRAAVPRRVGYAALAIAMAVIYAHGATTPDAGTWVGVAGAAISAIAKGMWTLVLRHTAHPLPERTQKWLQVRRGEVGAQLALSSQLRELARTEEQHAALLAASPALELPPVQPFRVEQDTETPSVPARPAPQDDVPPPNPKPVPPDEDKRDPEDAPVVPLSPGETLTDAVRAAIKAGAQDKYAALRHVMAAHGDDVNGASVIRIYNRLTKHTRRAG